MRQAGEIRNRQLQLEALGDLGDPPPTGLGGAGHDRLVELVVGQALEPRVEPAEIVPDLQTSRNPRGAG